MLLVQKFGGSSVASMERMRHVAERVAGSVREGHQVVVVVSAMGDTTDELLEKANQIRQPHSPREMDVLLSTGENQSAALLSMTLESLGIPACSFSGREAGIHTDPFHGNAQILSVDPKRLVEALGLGMTPVVAGFQGVGPDDTVTTLGRGGSDLTAIALANALGAQRCEIFSDVAGVFTADPRVVPKARPLAHIPFEDMAELANQGAQVLQTKAVEYAWGNNVTIYARSTFDDQPGTRIDAAGTAAVASSPVTAVACDTHIVKIGLTGVPDAPGVAAQLFGRLAERGINVDLIIQSLSHQQLNDLAFTVTEAEADRAEAEARAVAQALEAAGVVVDRNVAKVSAVGTGMLGRPGVAARVFNELGEAGINIQMIGTSEIKISCIIARADAHRALNALHQAFQLGGEG